MPDAPAEDPAYRRLFDDWGAAVDAWADNPCPETRLRFRELSDALRRYREHAGRPANV